ncbi:MAG: hypothetical protein B6241_00695 [Spirochaetaceae bacterium 4572_59]|nr:MAG: hypothetical protein B6241_00695 [Spirochaetaceae bacterium 4572_59]
MNRSKFLILILLLLFTGLWSEADTSRLKSLGFSVPEIRTEALPFHVIKNQQIEKTLIPEPGNVILINFWASWCPPCGGEMPSLQRLYEKLKDSGFQLATVNMNEEIPTVQDYLRSESLDIPVYYFPDKGVLKVYTLRGIPASYLIDKKGRVAAAYTGSFQWDNPELVRTIEELLNE